MNLHRVTGYARVEVFDEIIAALDAGFSSRMLRTCEYLISKNSVKRRMRQLPIGIQDFTAIRDGNKYFVDKSMLI